MNDEKHFTYVEMYLESVICANEKFDPKEDLKKWVQARDSHLNAMCFVESYKAIEIIKKQIK